MPLPAQERARKAARCSRRKLPFEIAAISGANSEQRCAMVIAIRNCNSKLPQFSARTISSTRELRWRCAILEYWILFALEVAMYSRRESNLLPVFVYRRRESLLRFTVKGTHKQLLLRQSNETLLLESDSCQIRRTKATKSLNYSTAYLLSYEDQYNMIY